MTVGELIEKYLSANKEMTISKLASIAEVPYTTLYSIIKRKSNKTDPITLKKIAAALNISPETFFEETKEDIVGQSIKYCSEHSKEASDYTGLTKEACDFLCSYDLPEYKLLMSKLILDRPLMSALCNYLNILPQDGAFNITYEGYLVPCHPGERKGKGFSRIYVPDIILKSLQKVVISELEKLRQQIVGSPEGEKLEKGGSNASK